jgi:hypothetical protein
VTDRIDELQRLHEAATQGPWEAMDQGTHRFNCYEVFSGGTSVCNVTCCESGQDERDCELIATMRNALPALLRVARAAKDIAGNVPLDIDPRIKWLEVQVGREEWAELLAAVAELEAQEGR